MRDTAKILILILAAVPAGAAPGAPVMLDEGPVEGVTEAGLTEYRGIPYAAPPIGELRWRPPQPALHRDGVLMADHFPAQCPQTWPPLPTMPEEKSSEDCLYLNLWSPHTGDTRKRPVLVFFYGGGFQAGSASTPLYASGGLPRALDALLVNVNYRLGALGFMAHPLLSAESPHHVSGNYAVLDAIAALAWVRDNIEKFGGDPHRVTVIGESAGSFMINKLMISPLAEGLFQAAIAESSADMADMQSGNLAHAERTGATLAEHWHAGSLEALRGLSVDRVLASPFNARPIVDGYVLPRDTFTLYALGRQAKVPLLLGYNAAEGDYFAQSTTVERYRAYVRRLYGPFAPRLLRQYPAATDAQAVTAMARLKGEGGFGWQMYAWAEINARTSTANTYLYRFDSHYGNSHGAELPFVFQFPFGGPWDEGQRQIGRVIAGYWGRFAASGDPNGAGAPTWVPYDPARKHVMELGDRTGDIPIPDLEQHLLLEAFENSKRPPELRSASAAPSVQQREHH